MRTIAPWPAILLAVPLLAGTGCFNDWFRDDRDTESGSGRFELVVEPNRTLVEGTHFLVDRATGDLWRLDTRDRRTGSWVRLADGPTDVATIAPGDRPEPEPDDD